MQQLGFGLLAFVFGRGSLAGPPEPWLRAAMAAYFGKHGKHGAKFVGPDVDGQQKVRVQKI